jgi:general transcriptional corepressor CYC8
VVAENPVHAKVLQQLGWLFHQDGPSFQNQDLAIQYLTKSLEAGNLFVLLSVRPLLTYF